MPPLSLEGATLGEKHRHFNKLVQDANINKQFNFTTINYDDGDIVNLLKIDTAGKTKNVDYIIKVLKCHDMLYVSRAIKKSTWLITEQEYAHIIHPEYLHAHIFPHMLTKAINKLLLHIRLHLKDEKRVEGFYNYFKNTHNEAPKWLLTCSLSFVENVLQNKTSISLQLYKRLCKRSVVFMKYCSKIENRNDWRALEEVSFLITSHTEEYLNVLESLNYIYLHLGKKHTETIMKTCPNRILDKFEKYMNYIDLLMVAKHMRKDEIKDFLLKCVKNKDIKHFFSHYDHLKHFIKNMPNEHRFEFVKKTFIDKIEYSSNVGSSPGSNDVEMDSAVLSDCLPTCSTNIYRWYYYAPFNIAFTDLKKMIRAESSPSERCAMLSVLITCAKNNESNTKTLLQYYYDKHRNEPFKFKVQFVNSVIIQMKTHEFDTGTWNILNSLFHSMEVYIESGNDVQLCLKCIVLYKILHNENIPDIVEKKIAFDTFKKFQNKLIEEQRNMLFSYLLSFISGKIQKRTITTETDFNNVSSLIVDAFNLLIDWKKDIKDYAFLLAKVQELINIKKHNNLWDVTLSSLYNMKTSWRKHMFEESILLNPSEEVCINALKHDPQLLSRYSDQVDALRIKETISLKRFLTKIRIYWIDSLAQLWIHAYNNNMNNTTAIEAVIRGLFMLLPQKHVTDLAMKYVPKETKIVWGEVNQTELSICKNIAKHFYVARPLIPLDVVLWYAKGDYLQYVVPSLNSILYNVSKIESRDYITKLLDAPVSLQKHGIQLAFKKLSYHELQPIFTNIWKTTKNSTIRTHLFTSTYTLLCLEKEPSVAQGLWELLSMFIDNLTADENMAIYTKLGKPNKVHESVRKYFFMKSYEFLASLPASANCETHVKKLISYAPHIMHSLEGDFVADKMLAPIEEKISKPRSQFIDVISSYVLHGKTEDEQCGRYTRVLIPTLKYAFKSWNMIKDDVYVMKDNIDALTRSLTWDFRRFSCKKTIVPPVKMFSELKNFMEQNLPIQENYEKFTTWKLLAEYVKLVADHKDMLCDTKLDQIPLSDFDKAWLPEEAEEIWEKLHIKVSPIFGKIIVKCLKEDTEKYFPTICWIFSYAVNKLFANLMFQKNSMKMETLKYMIIDEDFIPSYIVVCEEFPKYCNDEDKEKRSEILKILSAHPSLEVKMHYHRAFAELVE